MNFIKKILNYFNLEVKKIPDYEKNKYVWLKEYNIKTIFDIGANKGQFSMEILKYLPHSQIFAFEPIQSCFIEFQRNMRNWENVRGFNCALGERNEEKVLYISDYSPSSSIREMSDVHKKAFPFTAKIKEEKVTIKTLDGIIKDMSLAIEDNVLIKVDVQGYEDKVISGGKAIFSRAKVVIIEVSFVELYEGQPLFESIYKQLVEIGHKFSGNLHILFSPVNGFPLQADAVFLKNA